MMHVIGQWKKGHPCHKVAKNLAESCSHSGVWWKVEIAKEAAAGSLAKQMAKCRVGVELGSFSVPTVKCRGKQMTQAQNC